MKNSFSLRLVMVLGALGGMQAACKEKAKEPEASTKQGGKSNQSGAPGGGGDDNGRDAVSWTQGMPKGLVKDADLKIGSKLKAMKADDIREYMAETTDYHDDKPEDDDDDDDDKCYQDAMSGIRIKARGNAFSMHGEIDVAKCADQEDAKFTSFKMIYDYAAACEHADFSKLDGKKFGELGSVEGVHGCDKGKKLEISRMESTYVGSVQVSGGTFEMQGDGVDITSTSDGEPCELTVADGLISYADGCWKLSRSITTRATLNGKAQPTRPEDAKLRIFEGVAKRATGEAPWYEKGSMGLRINDWKGKVTFKGAQQAPSFELTSAAGERVTGKVGSSGPAGLTLTGEATAERHELGPVERAHARLRQSLRAKIGP